MSIARTAAWTTRTNGAFERVNHVGLGASMLASRWIHRNEQGSGCDLEASGSLLKFVLVM
jgi:hypothetical protein